MRPAAQAPADREVMQSAAGFLDAVSAVRRAARRAARRSWQTEPLPPAQSELLRLAARTPGLTVAEAAAELRLAPNTVSTLVGKLTDKGLLERIPSSTDGRSVLLDVTAKARGRLAEWRDLRAELAGQALAGLSSQDRAALAAAIPAMRRLAGRMEARQR
ncbi:MAG TPA: MarR family transcriptional regulator [Streptosporangiaceae bacterium]|jgi:DNA-binding MarR family transcriptional regulator